MNLVLGSGLIGNLAKDICGADWGWIPFKRSRYYSFDIPFADDFITYDKTTQDYFAKFGGTTPVFYKRPFSYQGQLMYQDYPIAVEPYLKKVYGESVNPLAEKLLRTTFSVYPLSARKAYNHLEQSLRPILLETKKYGEVIKIDRKAHVVTCRNVQFEYQKVISTIPLDALLTLCGEVPQLDSKSVCYYYLRTDAIDLEGAEQALISDLDIKFFKVQQLSKTEYVFWVLEALENPLQYFGSFLNYKIDIMEAKRIEGSIPTGVPPDLGALEADGITCVGSNAQWDDFMDVGSCALRLIRLAGSV